MITVTLTINGVPTEKQLPTNWEDVSWQQFVELNEIGFAPGKTYQYAKYYLGIGPGNQLDTDSALLAVELLMFLCFPEQMLTKPVSSQVNIANESWAKLEKAKSAINAGQGDRLKCGAQVVKIYTDEDISGKPVTEALPLVSFFLPSWKSFLRIMRSCLNRMRVYPKS